MAAGGSDSQSDSHWRRNAPLGSVWNPERMGVSQLADFLTSIDQHLRQQPAQLAGAIRRQGNRGNMFSVRRDALDYQCETRRAVVTDRIARRPGPISS